MSTRAALEETDVLILCGGRGERLRPVLQGRPKPLAPIGDKVFLDILIDNVIAFGFKRIILSVGYLKEQIITHCCRRKDCVVEFCEEETPLGTGGAVKNARKLIQSGSFLVMNGDSMCSVDLGEFHRFHLDKQSILSLVTTRTTLEKGKQDYGNVSVDDDYRIRSFAEKIYQNNSGLINSGIYLMQRDIFEKMPSRTSFSLEYDLFPAILDHNCHAFISNNTLIDIGTPERYHKAVCFLTA